MTEKPIHQEVAVPRPGRAVQRRLTVESLVRVDARVFSSIRFSLSIPLGSRRK